MQTVLDDMNNTIRCGTLSFEREAFFHQELMQHIMKVLTDSQIESFHTKGYIKIPGLLGKDAALKIQGEIWAELYEEFGIKKEDRKSWVTPPHSPRKAKVSQTNKDLINDKFRASISTLLGSSDWKEPTSWGGFLVNFPENEPKEWDLSNKLWHWDYELFRTPELGGLLIFSFYSEVLPRGGGTLIVSGSHRALRQFNEEITPRQKEMKHGQHRKYFMKKHPYFRKLTDPALRGTDHIDWFMNSENIVQGIPLQVLELTGRPGDVVFCHPRLIHAPAGINLGQYPRIMRTKFLW